jgi:hypothetical protein
MSFIQRPTHSSSTGTRYTAQPNSMWVVEDGDLNEDPRPFNTLFHETEIHEPFAVIRVSEDEGFNTHVADCLDMPIRFAGEQQYAIPDNWAALTPALKTIIDIEHSNNPNWKDYYTYLSVHYTGGLKKGQQQRHGGAHTDGFQGVRVAERTKTSRSYVAVTNGGTFYYPQTFVADLDASEFNVFQGFDLQINKDENGEPITGIAEEKMFYFFDAYTVHESGAAARDGSRLFVRLTWEMKLFDRAENTHNNMLDYDWKPEHYDVRSDLQTPTLEDIEKARLVK